MEELALLEEMLEVSEEVSLLEDELEDSFPADIPRTTSTAISATATTAVTALAPIIIAISFFFLRAICILRFPKWILQTWWRAFIDIYLTPYCSR